MSLVRVRRPVSAPVPAMDGHNGAAYQPPPPGGPPAVAAPAPVQTGVAAGATGDPGTSPDSRYAWGALLLVVIGIAGGTYMAVNFQRPGYTPPEGISNFAVFYLIAQALERLSELLRQLFPQIGATSPSSKGLKTKNAALGDRDVALAAAIESPAKDSLENAAKAQSVLNTVRANTAVIYLGINVCLASLLCGALGLLFLKTVGMTWPPVFLDVIVSGFAVGGGTKPLHDLISHIQKSNKKQEDPPEIA
jgi:hypothetical protein